MRFVEELRKVRTIEGGQKVYQDAKIMVASVDPNEISPTSKYVLTENLERIRTMGDWLSGWGIDIYNLRGLIHIDDIVMAPPIVEVDEYGQSIIDGIHRCYEAKRLGKRITVALVEGANQEPIGLPLKWEEVKELSMPPKTGEERRNLRVGITDNPTVLRRHYRDFSVFGSQGRRPRNGQYG